MSLIYIYNFFFICTELLPFPFHTNFSSNLPSVFPIILTPKHTYKTKNEQTQNPHKPNTSDFLHCGLTVFLNIKSNCVSNLLKKTKNFLDCPRECLKSKASHNAFLNVAPVLYALIILKIIGSFHSFKLLCLCTFCSFCSKHLSPYIHPSISNWGLSELAS